MPAVLVAEGHITVLLPARLQSGATRAQIAHSRSTRWPCFRHHIIGADVRCEPGAEGEQIALANDDDDGRYLLLRAAAVQSPVKSGPGCDNSLC